MHFSGTLIVALAAAVMARPSALDTRQAQSFSCTATVRSANTLLTSFQAFDENGKLFAGKELPKNEGECAGFLKRLQGIAEENGLADRPPFRIDGIGKRQAPTFSCTATVRSANTLLTSFQAFDENGKLFKGTLPESEGECAAFLRRLQGIAEENGLADRPPFRIDGIGKRGAKKQPSCTATIQEMNNVLTRIDAYDEHWELVKIEMPKGEDDCPRLLEKLQEIAKDNGITNEAPFSNDDDDQA